MARKKQTPVDHDLSLADLEGLLTPKQLAELLARKKQQAKVTQDRLDYEAAAEKETALIVGKLLKQEEQLSRLKTECYKRLAALIARKKQVYGVDAPQKSYDFNYGGQLITVGYSEVEGWRDSAIDGISKIESYIQQLANDDVSAVLVATLTRLMPKTRKNQLRLSTLVSLENLLDDPVVRSSPNYALLRDGVTIVRKAWAPKQSCWSIRASVRDSQHKERSIATSLTSADFVADFDFKGF